MKQSLNNSSWGLRTSGAATSAPEALRDREIQAEVPGCVHTDLLRAGIIDDPYDRFVEREIQWIGQTDWVYRTEFDADPALFEHDNIDLMCHGLDTVVHVALNGVPIGSASNMHVARRWSIRDALRKGANELTVTFEAPVTWVRQREQELGAMPRSYSDHEPYNAIRKMACNFGWDWGPVLTTAGICRSIEIDAWSTARMRHVRPLVRSASESRSTIDVCADLVSGCADSISMEASLVAPDGVECAHALVECETGTDAGVCQLDVTDPQRWWPRGYGDQALYDLTVTLRRSSDGAVVDTWTSRIGLREVRLDTSKDDIGSAFTLRVNGRPIFCKGANWIPDDCFPTRVDSDRFRSRIHQACDAGMNMLRIWGGGVYEDDAFYDICDEMGVLVWQDFAFACAFYAEDEPLRSEVQEEARDNVARLSRHASLALWCGSNENIWGAFDWWPESRDTRAWGLGYYLKLLPGVMRDLDPTRPYWPSSPWSGSMDIAPLDSDHGNRHTWDRMLDDYRQVVPRFLSEFGHQAPPQMSTLRECIDADQLTVGSEAMHHRQRAAGGNEERIDAPMARLFKTPESFDDWHYLAQVVQARAVSICCSWLRANMPRCMGVLYWQLNDCWPVSSWAAIDGRQRLKPLWYETRRVFADRMLTFQPFDDTPVLVAVNDTDEPWIAETIVERLGADGCSCDVTPVRFEIAPRASARLRACADLASRLDPHRDVLVARCDGCTPALWMFVPDHEFEYAPPAFEASLSDSPEQILTLRSSVLMRDVVIQIDRLDPDAEMSDQMVTLLPDQPVHLSIRSDRRHSIEEITSPPVFRCANVPLTSATESVPS